jgi:alkylhydroperoxidase family enzyme
VTNDSHAHLRDRVVESVLRRPGQSDSALRRAAADGIAAPPELQSLIDKIHRHAYKVTDDDVARLREKYSDDQLFEIIVSAALGASLIRLNAGLQVLDEA